MLSISVDAGSVFGVEGARPEAGGDRRGRDGAGGHRVDRLRVRGRAAAQTDAARHFERTQVTHRPT